MVPSQSLTAFVEVRSWDLASGELLETFMVQGDVWSMTVIAPSTLNSFPSVPDRMTNISIITIFFIPMIVR